MNRLRIFENQFGRNLDYHKVVYVVIFIKYFYKKNASNAVADI